MLSRGFFLLLLCGCVSKNTDHAVSDSTPTGVFSLYIPNYVQQAQIEKIYNGRLHPLPLTMIDLRKDGTYVFGYCDNQISEAGRYIVVGDSIGLFDRHNFDERMEGKPAHLRYDKSTDELFFITVSSDSEESKLHRLLMGKTPHNIISMNRKGKHHAGFLRGQEMSYDSLIRYYKSYDWEVQSAWVDSVHNAIDVAKK